MPRSDTAEVDERPLVSVLVVTYNSAADVEGCLRAVQRQKVAGGYEVIVVDNASTDDTVDLVAAHDGVRLLRQDTNLGYAAANNLAAREARGSILVLLNPDCVVDDGCLQELVHHLQRSTGVGVASALLRNPDGSPQHFARRDMTLGGALWDLTDVGRRIDRRWRHDAGRRSRRYSTEFEAGLDAPLDVFCPAAACIALWRDLARPRLFNETFPLFFNDGELCARLRDRSYRCEVVPAAGAVHGYGTGHAQVPSARKQAEFVSSLRTYARVRHGVTWCALLWLILVTDVLLSVVPAVVRRDGRRRAHVRGTLGGLGLPGGARPWLAAPLPLRRRLRLTRTRLGDAFRASLRSAGRRRRRRRFIGAIRRQAWLLRARVTLDIDPRADIGTGVRVELRRSGQATIRIGAKAKLHPGVLFRMWGGTLVIAPGVEIRGDTALTVKGLLELSPRVVIGRGSQVHADGTMVWDFAASAAERTTVIDTDHTFDDAPLMHFDKPVRQADVTLEPFAFIGAGAVVTSGVRVGRGAIVGAMSVVTRDVEPYTIVAGAPARPVRSVDSVGSRRAGPA